MEDDALQHWLSQPRTALVAAIAEGIAEHVVELRAQGVDFYGYALLPGEPYDINSLVAAANTEADIQVPQTDNQYVYYRYSVDEWEHWHNQGFSAASQQLQDLNQQFQSLHAKAKAAGKVPAPTVEPSPFLPAFLQGQVLDDFQIAHSRALLDAVVAGLQQAQASGVFGVGEKFLVVWISDSDHEVMADSARQLNPPAVAREFVDEFFPECE